MTKTQETIEILNAIKALKIEAEYCLNNGDKLAFHEIMTRLVTLEALLPSAVDGMLVECNVIKIDFKNKQRIA
jgi:hypothetical protein